MNNEELNNILKEHKKWLETGEGSKANLQYANLQGANLRWANLQGANLQGANLTDTCLDPQETPNGDVAGFETDGKYVYGYRTKKSHFVGTTTYKVGKQYRATIFSVSDTECHPGLYLSSTREEVYKLVGINVPTVKVRSLAKNVHRAGSKWRTKHFLVVEEA